MSLQFLYPNILWGLTVLLIPIIIHLFNFKRFKKIYFSNLNFLKNLNVENQRKSKLKKWLILLFRLLALACIIIAFSQPYVADNNSAKNVNIQSNNFAIYIDNSFSMNAETEKGNALEFAKNSAFELINSFPTHSKIRIYTNDITNFSSSLNQQQAISRVQEIVPSPTPVLLSDQLKKISLNNEHEIYQLYVLSDFQESQSDIDNIILSENHSYTFLPLSVQRSNNLLIDTCWFEKPFHTIKQSQEISIRIKNNSNQAFEKIPIKLSINDSTKSVSSFSIDENSEKVVKLKYVNHHAGSYNGKIEINDFPITYDNQLFFSYSVNEFVNILAVNQNEPNKYLTRLFSSSDSYQLVNISKSKIFNENIKTNQLVILNELNEIESGLSLLLKEYINNGGQIAYIPGTAISNSINQFLDEITSPTITAIDSSKQNLAKIETQSELYQNVFKELKKNARLPLVLKHYKLRKSNNNLVEALLQTQGGDNILTKVPFGSGYVYLFSVQINSEWSNLATHPIFVPTFINLTRGNGSKTNLYNILGSGNPIPVKRIQESIHSNQSLHIVNKATSTDIIPVQKNSFDKGVLLYPNNQITKADNYQIMYQDSILKACSFNYSRTESEMNYISFNELKETIEKLNLRISLISPSKMKLSEVYNEQGNGKQYWKIFIMLCLLFIFCETILHRVDLFKN